MADTDPPVMVEFELGLHVSVEVVADLVPAEWLDPEVGEIPKRLYNWPEALTNALHDALADWLRANAGAMGYDEATLISDSHDLPPSTN